MTVRNTCQKSSTDQSYRIISLSAVLGKRKTDFLAEADCHDGSHCPSNRRQIRNREMILSNHDGDVEDNVD